MPYCSTTPCSNQQRSRSSPLPTTRSRGSRSSNTAAQKSRVKDPQPECQTQAPKRDRRKRKQAKKDKEESPIAVLLAVGLMPNVKRKLGGLPYDLNRMHVMEDVEEGCDVSGALPSSPGHAEQRPDPTKEVQEISTPTEQSEIAETSEVAESADTPPPTENGLSPSAASITNEKDSLPEEPENDEKKESDAVTENAVKSKEHEFTVFEETPEVVKVDENKEEADKKTKTPVGSPAESSKESQEAEQRRENDEDSLSENSQLSNPSSKRKCDEDEQIGNPAKKLRSEILQQFLIHDRMLSDYIESINCNSVEDLQHQVEQLFAEIRTLGELAKEKEREWNNIIHMKKVKEELLIRMQRKKQILLDWDISNDQIDDQTKGSKHAGGNVTIVPVSASSPVNSVNSRPVARDQKQDKIFTSRPKSILSKNTSMNDVNGQGECRQGRQGPIVDVRSIIADYRQRHPETVPRRGRRLKSVLNSAQNDAAKVSSTGNVLSMSSLALGSGSQVRQSSSNFTNELNLLFSAMDSVRQNRPPTAVPDSSMTSLLEHNAETPMTFKDVLVQIARMSQTERREFEAQAAANMLAAANNKPPPPPYPEVTLHPVPSLPVTHQPVPPTQNNSLLHGILTKNQPRADSKPTTFSPTLARLLTAPERVSNNNAQVMYTAALNSGVSISDLLSTSGKSRNEITITRVGQCGQNTKTKSGVRLDDEEAEDSSADRLVIDESNELNTTRTDNGSEAGDDVPQCQGCHQKSAQFVCAGCGNQWYCSRDCQVAAWDDHSEVCCG